MGNVHVMLDRDLAVLYGVEVKRLNQQVNRNLERFLGRFMHQMTAREFEDLKLQIATSSLGDRCDVHPVYQIIEGNYADTIHEGS